jgi:hypothetical protein
VELLELDRAAHTKAGMASLGVVPALYPFEDGVGKLVAGPPFPTIEDFQLQGSQNDSIIALS